MQENKEEDEIGLALLHDESQGKERYNTEGALNDALEQINALKKTVEDQQIALESEVATKVEFEANISFQL